MGGSSVEGVGGGGWNMKRLLILVGHNNFVSKDPVLGLDELVLKVFSSYYCISILREIP